MIQKLLTYNQVRAFLKLHPQAHWVQRGDLFEVFTDPPQQITIHGGPMRYRRPAPLDAEQVDKIVRGAAPDYGRIEKIIHAALRAQRQPLRVDSDELCCLLHVSERTLSRWISNHIIPYEQVPTSKKRTRGKLLFDLAAVDKALKRWRRNAVGD